jgi:hypothetical protein
MPARDNLLAPWDSTARLLPFPLAPVPSETVLSLLRRPASAHAVPLGAMLRQIGAGISDLHPDGADLALTSAAWSRLATMTGREVCDLSRAIGAAPMPARRSRCDHQPFVVTTLVDGSQVVAACRSCCLARGVLDDTVELPAARRHTPVLATPAPTGRQLDISGLPELLRAHHRHPRLAARLDSGHLASAEAAVHDVIAGWRRDPRHLMTARFRSREALIWAQHAPGVVPASLTTCPEMVHLTAMIFSLHWAAIATQGRRGQDRFLHEANHQQMTPLLAWLRSVNGHRGRVAPIPRTRHPCSRPTAETAWMGNAQNGSSAMPAASV